MILANDEKIKITGTVDEILFDLANISEILVTSVGIKENDVLETVNLGFLNAVNKEKMVKMLESLVINQPNQ